jgi:hypothetical protein
MQKAVLIDEIHLSMRVRRGLSESTCKRLSQVLKSRRFLADLRRAIRGVFRQHRQLNKLQFMLSR